MCCGINIRAIFTFILNLYKYTPQLWSKYQCFNVTGRHTRRTIGNERICTSRQTLCKWGALRFVNRGGGPNFYSFEAQFHVLCAHACACALQSPGHRSVEATAVVLGVIYFYCWINHRIEATPTELFLQTKDMCRSSTARNGGTPLLDSSLLPWPLYITPFGDKGLTKRHLGLLRKRKRGQ